MKKYPKVIAIDFDETLGLYDPSQKLDGYRVKEVTNVPNPRMVDIIFNLRRNGHRVVLWSSRWWGDYNSLKEWLDKHEIVVDDIILGRFKADVYLCDKSINAHDENLERKTVDLLEDNNSWGKWYKKYYGKLQRSLKKTKQCI